nr:MAG TPA: hypothetical protein [Caudoviricetes sp.]DAT26176.1 MAG TPA: hypothetical protein [Caudoviricetes sp.]
MPKCSTVASIRHLIRLIIKLLVGLVLLLIC